jgi:hypothetical protein
VALKRRSLQADIKALKWPLGFFVLSIASTVGFYLSTQYFWNDILRKESNTYSELNYVSSQVLAIEEAEQIFIENIDRFNEMVVTGVLDEEDRVALLAEIGGIRDSYRLFPISVTVSEQERWLLNYPAAVENPEESISLRGSKLQVSLPLLHEEDLTRFLADFLAPNRLLVTNRCELLQLNIADEELLAVVPHQRANCEFYWYTLQREAFVQEEYYSE